MTIDVLEIGRYLVATLRADSALRTLMGITTNDPRVYLYYSGGALIDPAQNKRAYITYAQTAEPERSQATGGPVFSLAIWAVDMDVAAAVAQRLKVLLDKEGEPEATITANGQVYQPVLVGSHFSSQENTKFAGIQMQFRFGFSHV